MQFVFNHLREILGPFFQTRKLDLGRARKAVLRGLGQITRPLGKASLRHDLGWVEADRSAADGCAASPPAVQASWDSTVIQCDPQADGSVPLREPLRGCWLFCMYLEKSNVAFTVNPWGARFYAAESERSGIEYPWVRCVVTLRRLGENV